MELDELKQKWNALDERLSKSEVYNQRMLQEMLKNKNKTAYSQLQGRGIYGLIVTLLVATVVLPLCNINGVLNMTELYILESICLLGIAMEIPRLVILSRFDVTKNPQEQLRNLVNYKRCYLYEVVIGGPLVCVGVLSTLFIKEATSSHGIIYVLCSLVAGGVCCWLGWKKHQSTAAEIKQNLDELNEL